MAAAEFLVGVGAWFSYGSVDMVAVVRASARRYDQVDVDLRFGVGAATAVMASVHGRGDEWLMRRPPGRA